MKNTMFVAITAGVLSALAAAMAQAVERLPVVEVPEPATLTLLGLGLVGAALTRRRKD